MTQPVERMRLFDRLLQLQPAVAQMHFPFESRLEPFRVTLCLFLAAHPAPQARSDSRTQRWKTPMTKDITAESSGDGIEAPSLQEIDEIRPRAAGHEVISAVPREDHGRPCCCLAIVL